MKSATRDGIVAGFAAAVTVAVGTAFGFATAAYPGKVLQPGCLTYIGWSSGLVFVGSVVAARYYDSVPGDTPAKKLAVLSGSIGIPALASGQLLPATRPFLKPYPKIPAEYTVPANLTFFILGGIIAMAVFMYVFEWRGGGNPIFAGGKASG